MIEATSQTGKERLLVGVVACALVAVLALSFASPLFLVAHAGPCQPYGVTQQSIGNKFSVTVSSDDGSCPTVDTTTSSSVLQLQASSAPYTVKVTANSCTGCPPSQIDVQGAVRTDLCGGAAASCSVSPTGPWSAHVTDCRDGPLNVSYDNGEGSAIAIIHVDGCESPIGPLAAAHGTTSTIVTATMATTTIPGPSLSCPARHSANLTVLSRSTTGAALSGFFVDIWAADFHGTQASLASGYTPLIFSLCPNTTDTTVGVLDYGCFTFDHWLDSGSAMRYRPFSISNDTTFTAVFRNTCDVASGSSGITVNAVDGSGNAVKNVYTTL